MKLNRLSQINNDQYTPTMALNKAGVSPGQELRSDLVSISKEFAKGTTSGSSGALSNAKESAKVDKQRQSEKMTTIENANKVTPTKSMAASQGNTDKQASEPLQGIAPNSGKNRSVDTPQAKKSCPGCNGMGCSRCMPWLGELLVSQY